VTRKGLEVLDAYRKIHSLLTHLEKEVGGAKQKPTAPMDYVGAGGLKQGDQKAIRIHEGLGLQRRLGYEI
jgi:hypothetical protein